MYLSFNGFYAVNNERATGFWEKVRGKFFCEVGMCLIHVPLYIHKGLKNAEMRVFRVSVCVRACVCVGERERERERERGCRKHILRYGNKQNRLKNMQRRVIKVTLWQTCGLDEKTAGSWEARSGVQRETWEASPHVSRLLHLTPRVCGR
jgi:hypothetical protein